MLASAGVDTWSVCWYLRDQSPACKAMESLATVPAARSKLIEETVADHRVGWFPGNRLLFAEGHPAGEGVLAGAADLPVALERLTGELRDRGILPPAHRYAPKEKLTRDGYVSLPTIGGTGLAGIRRLDSTVDMAFEDPLVGLSVLAGCAALPLPRIKTEITREVGGRRLETVTLKGYSGRNILGRIYDKGVHPETAMPRPRGTWIRPEDQRRYKASTRPPVEAVASTSYIRDAFVQRFEPLWKASKGVKVGGVLAIGKELDRLIAAGDVTPRQAELLAGFMVLDACGVEPGSRSTKMRRQRRLREHGLVLSDGVLDEVQIDLGEVLEEAMDSSVWGARG